MRNSRLERRVVREHLLQIRTADNQCGRDVRRNRKLQCGRAKVDTVPRRNRTQPSALLDGLSRNLIIILAIIEARAAADEAGVERRSDDKGYSALARLRKDLMQRILVIDQRILTRQETDVRIGDIHQLQNRLG